MKTLLSIFLAIALPLAASGQGGFTKINSLPIRNDPQSTDSIPASDAAGTTWRIPFSKFGTGGGGGTGLPDMTGNANKVLTNNGTTANWTLTPTITLTNATGLPLATGISGFVAGATNFLGTGGGTSALLRALLTDETGTGIAYFVGGALGTPSSVNLTNGTSLPASGIGSGIIAPARLGSGSVGTGSLFLADDSTYKAIPGGGDALTSNGLGQFAPTTSSAFAGVISDETGTGAVVLSGSPQFTGSPLLGSAPSSPKYAITGTGGGGFIDFGLQNTAPAAPGTGNVRIYSNASGQLAWLTSANAFNASIATSTLTANRAYVAPNKGGEILVGNDLNLASGTVLTVGEHYYDNLGANRTLTFTGTPVAGGNSIILRLNVTTASTLTFPASIRVGSTSVTPITTLALPLGQQLLSWRFSNGAWYLIDTVADSSGLVPDTRTVAGHPLSSDVVLADDDIVFSDNTTNNATTGQHGYLRKLSGSSSQFIDGTGNWSSPPGTGVPTGTGFYHITSGVQDAAAVTETGTGNVVRAFQPTIDGIANVGLLSLSSVINVTLTADQNNWAPAGFTTTFNIRTDATATDRTITGIASPSTGRVLLITNISASANLTLSHANVLSTATNRFDFGGSDFIIPPAKSALLRYDNLSSRWRLIGGAALVNDAIAPGNFKFYGTNAIGVKGYVDLAPDTTNLLAGSGSGAIADTGIDSGEVLTSSNISSIASYSIPLSALNFTDIDIATTLSGSTYTLAPGRVYYGDVTGNKTFAFSPAFTNSDAPTTLHIQVTGTGTWTLPTLIREGATGSTTSAVVGSTGYFTVTFLKTGAGNIRMIDDIPQLLPVVIGIAASDEATALTTGTAKATFRMPYAMTVTGVYAELTTAQASGSIFTVDINEGGTSILSTKLTIDNTEDDSSTAAAAAVLSDTALALRGKITVDIDQIGASGATGLKIWLIGGR